MRPTHRYDDHRDSPRLLVVVAHPDVLRDQVAGFVEEIRPTVVVTLDASDGHRDHASQVPPFDAMDADLGCGFLAVDRLLRVYPPWEGGPPERSWTSIPSTRRVRMRRVGHHTREVAS